MLPRLVGKQVAAFRGRPRKDRHDPAKTVVQLDAILFGDGQTYMTFCEQSPYDYHDCCEAARVIDFWQDRKEWEKMMNKEGYDEPTEVGF